MVPHMNYCVLVRNTGHLTRWLIRERKAVYCENHTLTYLLTYFTYLLTYFTYVLTYLLFYGAESFLRS